MSDFDPAETIVSTDVLAAALQLDTAQIYELTRLGILRPVTLSIGLQQGPIDEPRYEFLESLRSFLRHYRAQIEHVGPIFV